MVPDRTLVGNLSLASRRHDDSWLARTPVGPQDSIRRRAGNATRCRSILRTYHPHPSAISRTHQRPRTDSSGHIRMSLSVADQLPWHRLYLKPDPQGRGRCDQPSSSSVIRAVESWPAVVDPKPSASAPSSRAAVPGRRGPRPSRRAVPANPPETHAATCIPGGELTKFVGDQSGAGTSHRDPQRAAVELSSVPPPVHSHFTP